MKKVESNVLDVLKDQAAKEPFIQVSETEEKGPTSRIDAKTYSDSKESYYKRLIEPWPMPCKDGTRISYQPDRGTIKRSIAFELPDAKEEEMKPTNPYILPKPLPARKPQNYGFPLYRMVTLPISTKRLICTDENGNRFQLAPAPRYNPFE